MGRSPDPRKGAWKNQGASQPSQSGKPGEWKNQQTKTDSVLPFWRRKPFKIGMAIASLGIVSALVVVVILWLQPEPPPRLILITAGYEDNLAVPQNVAGRRAARAMQNWAEKHNSTTSNPKDKIEVESGVDVSLGAIDRALPPQNVIQKGPAKVIVHVAAHGVVTLAPPGQTPTCCLVPGDYPARGEDRELYGLYKLDDLLKLLKDRLPAKTMKLLVLDVTSVAAHWPLGQFQSDFARTLKSPAYEAQIKAVPNLVVMLSSDHNQRSWAAPDRAKETGTAFSHFLAEGLMGAAPPTKGQLLDAEALHKHVSEKVQHHARNNRARFQTPLLIDPNNQAKNVQLRIPRGEYKAPDAAPRADDEAIEKELRNLEGLWDRSYVLAKTSPPPWAFAPERWRVYVDTLHRVEELIRAGDVDSARRLGDKVGPMADDLEQARREERPSHRLSASMPDSLGLSLSEPAQKLLDEFSQHLSRGEHDDCKKTLDKLRTALDRVQQSLVRVRAYRLLVRHVAKDRNASANRNLIARLATSLDSPESPPRPAEAHYLLMLRLAAEQESPAKELLAAGRWDLLEKALRLRVQAEEAACGLGTTIEGDPPAASEQVYPWIKSLIESADGHRRSGQDLLFASAETGAWERASTASDDFEKMGQLEKAASLYSQAQQDAAKVRRGLAARDRALAQLPYYTHWMAELPLVAEEENPLRAAWADLHRLSELLRDQPPADAKSRTNALVAIEDKAKSVTKYLDERKKAYKEKSEQDYSPRDRQDDWHVLERLLLVPALPDPNPSLVVSVKQRLDLIRAQLKIAKQLQISSEKGASKDIAGDPQKEARDEAQRQARLALAVLGNADGRFDASRDELRDLNRVVSDGDLVVIGQRVAERLIALSAKCQQLVEKAQTPAALLVDVRKHLGEAAVLARHLDGWAVTDRLGAGPVALARWFELHQFLYEQAGRTYLDHWASEGNKPYYQEAGDLFLSDARALLQKALAAKVAREKTDPRFEALDKEAERLKGAKSLSLVWASTKANDAFGRKDEPVHLTPDEPYVERFFRLLGPGDVGGHPMKWVELDKEGVLKPDPQKARSERALGEPGGFSCLLSPLGKQKAEVRHAVKAYFRGQWTDVTTPVKVYDEPDTLVVSAQRDKGRIAVRAKREAIAGFAKGKSAIAVVLDTSGSMNYPKDNPRWKGALRAFKAVLAELPEGVQISVRQFDATTTRPDTSVVWKSKKLEEGDRAKIYDKVAGLTPTGTTPLLKAIEEAVRDDLPEDFDGLRTVLVVTDGGDFFFHAEKPPAGTPTKAKYGGIQEFLEKTFSGKSSNVNLSVIGFDQQFTKEEANEEQAAKELRTAMDKLRTKRPNWFYADAKNVTELIEALKRSVLSTHFVVDADAGDKGFADEKPKLTSISDDKGLYWCDNLQAGLYTVRIRSVARIEQVVRVNPGDSLMLELLDKETRSENHFRRIVYARSSLLVNHHQEYRTAKKGDWLMALLQNQIDEPKLRTLSLMTTLEREDPIAQKVLAAQVVRPRWTWFEVSNPKAKEAPDLRVFALDGYPAPAWGMQLPNWSNPDAQVPALKAWWNTADVVELHRDKVALRMSRAPNDQLKFRDYREKSWDGDKDGVILQQMRYEATMPVPQEDGTASVANNCLVVHLRFPPGQEPFFVQPGETARWDWLKGGQIHRFYQEAGKYTGIFYPFTEEDVDNMSELFLISVKQLKKHSHTLHVGPDELIGPKGEKGPGVPTTGRKRPKAP